MGFVPARKVYKLVFADDDLEGLEVRAHSRPVGDMLGMVTLTDTVVQGGEDAKAQYKDKIHQTLERFADSLVSWNVEQPDGTPVPATLEGVLSQDLDFVLDVIRAWATSIAGVSRPLEQPSPNGEQSVAASIPMAALSPSLAS